MIEVRNNIFLFFAKIFRNDYAFCCKECGILTILKQELYCTVGPALLEKVLGISLYLTVDAIAKLYVPRKVSSNRGKRSTIWSHIVLRNSVIC